MTLPARTFLAALLVSAMLAFLGAPAIGAVQPHVLRFADGMDVSTLNPWYATTANVTRLSALTMAKFTRFDRDGRLVPELFVRDPVDAQRWNHGSWKPHNLASAP